MISASSLDRVALCAASEVLPHTIDLEEREATTLGTVVHAFLRDCNVYGRAEALARVVDEDHRELCEAIPVDQMPTCDPAAFTPEVAVSYNVADGTARILGKDIDRAYQVVLDADGIPIEVPGTADVVALTADGRGVVVVDYKTGRRVAPAVRNWQMRLLGLAFCKAFGREYADVSLGYVWPGRDPWYDRAVFDDFALMEAEAELADVIARVRAAKAASARGEVVQPVMGPQCDYCPARFTCPPRYALIRAATSAPREHVAPWLAVAELSDEECSDGYERLKTLQKLVDDAISSLYARAAMRPFATKNGYILGTALKTTEAIHDGALARKVLAERYGAEVADAASKWKVTKSDVESALRRVAEKRAAEAKAAGGKRVTLASVYDEAFELLRDAGAMGSKTTNEVREYKPKALPAGKGRAA